MFLRNILFGKKEKELSVFSDAVDPEMKIDAEAVLTKYNGHDERVTVPDGVKKIGPWAFGSNEFIKEVYLPQSVDEICAYAFERSSLEKLVIPDSVEKIGYCALRYCENLSVVVLPKNLQCIDTKTFQGCIKLKELQLPSTLKKAGDYAFEHCGIMELRIPDSMRYIYKDSFRSMDCLERLYLPSTLKGIGDGAFGLCGNLKEVNIPEGVIQIESGAFDACSKLEKAVLPESLITMSKSAFSRTRISDSQELKEIYERLNNVKTYPKPKGYQIMTFGGMEFFYHSEIVERETSGLEARIKAFAYECDIVDTQKIYRDKDGKKVLMIYVSVPTFDADDREGDSYRRLFLIPEKGEITGVMVCGGYKIAKILIYSDMRWADEKTEKLLKNTYIF